MSWLSQKEEGNSHRCRYKKSISPGVPLKNIVLLPFPFYVRNKCGYGNSIFVGVPRENVVLFPFPFMQEICASLQFHNFSFSFPYLSSSSIFQRTKKIPFRFHLYPPYHSSGRCPGIRIPSTSLGNNYKKVSIIGGYSFSQVNPLLKP